MLIPAQVWDVLQEAPLANYRGHVGYLLCVDWSPVDPDVIWTGGKDFTLQEWRVSKQEFTKPPKGEKQPSAQTLRQQIRLGGDVYQFLLSDLTGKKMVDLKEKMKSNSKQKKKTKKPSGALPAETNGEPVPEGGTAARGQELSDEDDEEDASSSNSPLPPPGERRRTAPSSGSLFVI